MQVNTAQNHPSYEPTYTPTRAVRRAPVTPRVTWFLIGLNVLVFLLMLFSGVSLMSPTSVQLLQWGANWGPLTVAHGQWWRLLSACFLHIGIIHIAFNMYVLYQIGPFTEPLFGGPRYLAIYLLTGIGGNLLGLALHPGIISAGASGAIFGVYGALLGFLLRRRASIQPGAARSVARSAGIFLVYNLAYGLLSTHTDLTAHIGGLVTGFVFGYLLAPPFGEAHTA